MTEQARTVLKQFPVRKSKKQKAQFRDWLCAELHKAGYETQVEKQRSLVTSHNVIAGDPDKARFIFTAHYDTCAALPLPNFITPCNFPAYLIYQMLLTAVIMIPPLAVTMAVLVLLEADPLAVLLVSYAVLLGLLWWLLDGPANRHNVNDNTSGVVTLLEIALSLTPEQREMAAFVFFDNEEKGLFGSSGFYRKHRKKMQAELLVNFDCVSDGDHILFFPRAKAKKNGVERLEQAYLSTQDKQVRVIKGFGFYPSDQKHFPVGVGVAALHRRPLLGYCLGRIHTWRDTVMDERNIELLRQGSLRLLEGENGEI